MGLVILRDFKRARGGGGGSKKLRRFSTVVGNYVVGTTVLNLRCTGLCLPGSLSPARPGVNLTSAARDTACGRCRNRLTRSPLSPSQ